MDSPCEPLPLPLSPTFPPILLYRGGPNARSFKLHRFAAPSAGRHVLYGLREVPAVAEGILGVVLPFAVHVLDRFGQDERPGGPRSLAVREGIFDADHH